MEEKIIQAIQAACHEAFGVEVVVDLDRPEPQFGDFACNVAMKLSKPLGKNPREVAQLIEAELLKFEIFSDVGVAGPGFINMTLKDNALAESILEDNTKPLSGLKILVEYSDPNPFKPLHAGHLYTTVVGDSIALLVENAGAETVRLNYGGDVGLHVAKSMWAILREIGGELPEKLTEIPEQDRANWLGDRYVEGNNAYEDEPQDNAEIVSINKRVYAIHEQNDRESAFAQIYWTCREWSYSYFTSLYKQLKVREFDRFIPESSVTKLGIDTVTDQLSKGVFSESDNAVVFKGEPFGLHTRVFITSEGLPTYETKDVGLSLTKWEDYHFDESIIITANEQSQYMQVVIKAIEQFKPEPAQRTKHLTHGMVTMLGGEKMSSRKGNVLLATDMIEAAGKSGENSGKAQQEDIVLAALKYALLKNRVGGDIAYDPEESVAMEGNSGPYLQYAHARARSILSKSDKNPTIEEDVTLDKNERLLARSLSEYKEVIASATMQLEPHHICNYLYSLSQEFNRFYENSKVVGSERENIRLWLVERYAENLKNGLQLLGINAPDSM